MDYTLIHYNVEAWEGRAFDYLKRSLLQRGWPIQETSFEPWRVIRGLVIDRVLGNVIKVNRYGYVKQALHGQRQLSFEGLRDTYRRTLVDLSEARYYFLNTLFSLSEACMYMQLVEQLDDRKLPGIMNYADLCDIIRDTLDHTHMEGELKAEILADPDQYVYLDPQVPQALLDQKEAGKKLLLITNSEWHYTKSIMEYAFDRYLPTGMTWQDLFELVVVSARKPAFFSEKAPIFEIINREGMLLPCMDAPTKAGAYLGGNAALIESYLQLNGDQILYVGDHIFSDVNASKSLQRWRTALIVRELEDEILNLQVAEDLQRILADKMRQKEALEYRLYRCRLTVQRHKHNRSLDGLGDIPPQPLDRS
jgi:HAD superfamily 5'-nucleotidase-like hydrolase